MGLIILKIQMTLKAAIICTRKTSNNGMKLLRVTIKNRSCKFEEKSQKAIIVSKNVTVKKLTVQPN